MTEEKKSHWGLDSYERQRALQAINGLSDAVDEARRVFRFLLEKTIFGLESELEDMRARMIALEDVLNDAYFHVGKDEELKTRITQLIVPMRRKERTDR